MSVTRTDLGRRADRRSPALRVAVLALTLAASALPAQHPQAGAVAREDSVRADSALDARTTALAVQLRCAVCQGISIQESPSALAREMRELVKEQLRAGRTEPEIKAYFVSKYGEWILLSPTTNGLNLLLYLAPVALLLGGLAVIAILVRRWSAPSPPPPDPGAP